MKIATLLGVREFLMLKDLDFPVLFDESEDRQTLVFGRNSIRTSSHGCPLPFGYSQYVCDRYVDMNERGGQVSRVHQLLHDKSTEGDTLISA